MPEFLKVLTYQNARQLIIDHFPSREIEYLPLEMCNHRVLAMDITSPEDMPAFARSTVDGYAVRAEDTFGSSESLQGMMECVNEVRMGEEPLFEIGNGQCAWIPTGGMLPTGSNAAVMVEYTEKLGEDTVLVSRPVAPGENVMLKGEDVSRGRTIFRSGRILKAQEIGLLASLGIDRVPVFKPYNIGILSTGDEIIPLDQVPLTGQVRDVNSYSLAAALESCGAIPRRYPLVEDDFASLQKAVENALKDNDVLIMSGGSSVGVADYSVEVMLSFPDSEMLFHGIAVKPGKPTIGVRVGEKLIIGLPGHPVSALMVFYILFAPVISPASVRQVEARMTVNVASQPGRDDFIPVQLLQDDEGREAKPLLGKSGLMSIIAQADGYVHIAYEKQGIKVGDMVKVNLF
ncbi:MAG: molybdopterin molybdenumtransferase MoeA [Firmicutes bacterium HGW-Firmicutes-15]|nr:MAG: molybdopterin molybdenumtransferase MoeA [Firmicutes bacterium HGW-Firmicutes-15]